LQKRYVKRANFNDVLPKLHMQQVLLGLMMAGTETATKTTLGLSVCLSVCH